MTTDAEMTTTKSDWAPSPLRMLFASIVGGCIALAVLNAIDPVFEHQAMGELPIEPSAEQIQAYIKTYTDFYGHNYALNLAIVGGLLGLVLGGATVSRMRAPSAIAGAILGAAGGAISGYLAGVSIGNSSIISADQSLVQSGLLHFGVWASMVGGIAIAVGLLQGGIGQAVKALLAGLVASLLVVVAYTLAASIVFPRANLIHPIPEGLAHRAIWIVTCSAVLGLGMSLGLRPAQPPKADAIPPGEV